MDTSGCVRLRREDAPWKGLPKPDIYWPDLSPFEQGYVEAMFASLLVDVRAPEPDRWDEYRSPRFSDLAPETLAAIRKDCAAWRRLYPQVENTARQGASFWRCRTQQLVEHPAFPPLTVTLNDAGKVVFS